MIQMNQRLFPFQLEQKITSFWSFVSVLFETVRNFKRTMLLTVGISNINKIEGTKCRFGKLYFGFFEIKLIQHVFLCTFSRFKIESRIQLILIEASKIIAISSSLRKLIGLIIQINQRSILLQIKLSESIYEFIWITNGILRFLNVVKCKKRWQNRDSVVNSSSLPIIWYSIPVNLWVSRPSQ